MAWGSLPPLTGKQRSTPAEEPAASLRLETPDTGADVDEVSQRGETADRFIAVGPLGLLASPHCGELADLSVAGFIPWGLFTSRSETLGRNPG